MEPTYQQICESVGKLYLESRMEIQQLSNYIAQLQSQFNEMNSKLISSETRLAKLQSLGEK